VPPHPLVRGEGTLDCGRGVGGVPIPTRGHTLWRSIYISTMWLQESVVRKDVYAKTGARELLSPTPCFGNRKDAKSFYLDSGFYSSLFSEQRSTEPMLRAGAQTPWQNKKLLHLRTGPTGTGTGQKLEDTAAFCRCYMVSFLSLYCTILAFFW
jgi:hypothetical protein